MPIAVAAAALVLFGLTARERRVERDRHNLLAAVQARAAAAADSTCQAELARAPNDSVRITIVDRCVARLAARRSA